MIANWNQCFSHILDVEGDFFWHKDDPGGATMMGITQKTYDRWCGRETTVDELRSLTVPGIEPIYREYYWHPVSGNLLPGGIDLLMFDLSVHAGWPRAVRMAQSVAGDLKVDGIIGPKTIGRLRAVDPLEFVLGFHDRKMKFYRRLKTWPVFGRGFKNRAEKARRRALDLLPD